MDSVYGEVRDLARVFGVQERGDTLVARLRARVQKATGSIDASGATLLYWFSDSKAPYLVEAVAEHPASSPGNSARRTSSTTHTRNGRRSAGRPLPTATPTSWSSAI